MLAAAMTILPGTALAATIVPVTNDATGATALATASLAAPATLSVASFDAVPATGTPNGTSDTLSSFPTDGSNFAILTSGDVNLADDANSSASSGADLGGATPAGRGDSAFDVSILKLNLTTPTGANCLMIDFQFYSEEFPEFVNSSFNDAFIAEYGSSTWTTSGSTITAANNFAFDPANEVISINAAGNTSMTAASAAGTTYDGATPLLQAATPTSAGTNSLYLSIFDQGDEAYDSAVFIDNIRFVTVANVSTDCVKGATPIDPPPDGGKKTPSTVLTKTPSATTVKSGSTVTYTYTETNDGEVDLTSPSVVDNKCSPVTYVSGDANIDGKLNVGETWTFTCSLQLWNTTTNTAVGHGITPGGLDVTWCDPKDVDPKDPKTFPKDVFCDQDEYAQVTVTVQDGCTPGYWKQDQHFDSWVGYTPGQAFSSVFDNAFGTKTLLQVLQTGGGGLAALGRHTVAALLNSTNDDVINYPYTTAQVISMFNAVYPGTKAQYTTLKNLFAAANEMGCSLN